MSTPESQVLAAIAELEAEENPDDITELVRWQIARGMERGDHRPEVEMYEDRRFTGQSFDVGGETYTFGVGVSMGVPRRSGGDFPRRPADRWTITVGESHSG